MTASDSLTSVSIRTFHEAPNIEQYWLCSNNECNSDVATADAVIKASTGDVGNNNNTSETLITEEPAVDGDKTTKPTQGPFHWVSPAINGGR